MGKTDKGTVAASGNWDSTPSNCGRKDRKVVKNLQVRRGQGLGDQAESMRML